MTKSRCFAFGCSYTQWFYPTWADIIGQNYEEFFNYGKGATSNDTMCKRFIEADNIHNITSDDLVIWGLSGIGRFNFLVNKADGGVGLWGCGDLQSDGMDGYIDTVEKWKPFKHIIRFMRDHYWDRKFGIYQTWIAVKTVKRILTANNTKHIIFTALDNSYYKDAELLNLDSQEVDMINEIYDLLDVKESLHEYNEKNHISPYEDTHPFIDSHFAFVKKHFPEYINDKTTEYFNTMYQQVKDIKDMDTAYNQLAFYKRMIHYNDARKLYAEYT